MVKTSLNQEHQVTTSAQSGVDIRQLSTILLRQRFVILGVSCVVMSVASFFAVTTKPSYQSYMQILVSSNLSEGAQSNNIPEEVDTKVSNSNLKVVDYTTQMKLMLSSKLLQKAVDLLHSDYPYITLEDIKGEKEHNKKAALKVTQEDANVEDNQAFSQVFEVSFNDDDPVKAQKVLQALQKVYQNYNTEQKKERLDRGLAFVNTRIPEVKKEATKADKNLEQFRKKHNLLDPETQSKILLQSLADVQQQLQTTRAQLQDVNARYDNLQQEIASSSEDNAKISSRLNQSSRYQTLLNEIQKTELALAKERLRYTDDYPSVQKLKQQRENEIVLLRQEVKNITSSKREQPLKNDILGVDPKLVDELILLQTNVLGLTANEKSLVQSEQQLNSEIGKYPNLTGEYNRLRQKAETSHKTLEQLIQAQQSLGMKIAQEGYNWQILGEPTLGSYVENGKLLFLLGGGVIGPILGILAALILEKFNDAIYCAADLKRLTNLRVLGTVPKLRSPHPKKPLLDISWNKQRSLPPSMVEEASANLPVHETLDMIYQNIKILKYPLPFKSLMVTSALPGEGKTTLVLGLVASATRMHRRVLVIDANLQNPNLHKTLGLSNDWGLSLLLVDEITTDFQDYIQPIHPFIDILTAGPVPEDRVQLLSSQRMKELIELFEESYDLVLIDASSILATVDARIIASFCNAIVMVERMGKVTQTQFTQATEILSKLNLIGIIANEVR